MADPLWKRARPFAGVLAQVSLLSTLASTATLALPWLAGTLLADVVITGQGVPIATLVLLLAALVITTAASIAASIASARASGQILATLQADLADHVQHLPMAFHDSSRQGDLLSAITSEVYSLAAFLTATMAQAPALVLTAAGSSVLLFIINPALAIVVPLVVPAFFIILRLVGRRLRSIAARGRAAHARLMFLAEAQLEVLSATKAFAVEREQSARFAEATEEARRLTFLHNRITAFLGPLVALAAAAAAIGMLLLAGGKAGELAQQPAELFRFLLYTALLTRPMGSLAEFYGRWQVARGMLARLESILEEAAEPGYLGGAEPLPGPGAIRFEGLDFSYPGRPPVLHGASVAIEAGETVALVGENGAGKSTLVNLLLRFYQPDAGRILVDGQDIAGLQVQALRRRMGYVPQRALLFNGTVHENIVFSRPGVTEDRVREAARQAQALDFITDLPNGFATLIGDHGVLLSGGQRQRIALARALLAEPQILILDEATSMYDLAGEVAFVRECHTALKGRTVIIVTHRPASLELADRILRVEGGVFQEVTGPFRCDSA